ncbi:MAG: hypothetical protein JO256_08970 [Alphaproteobacteria bacterium]|nr:hypothetical protein [Alphaproteobacteria bacterium]
MRNFIPLALLACSLSLPAVAQSSSASVSAGNLRGSVTVGANTPLPPKAEPQRGDDRCDSHGVEVRSADGSSSASASVTTSLGGSAVVAGGGSPGSTTRFVGCEARNIPPDHVPLDGGRNKGEHHE